ncbi:class III lanthionine synthetase LanKC [Streptomyces tsukubensis]|uniref:Serine/threonine protein kinase n=1 Tax=Streptomyces tsukubensis TaxID=83656 RepID=A0A1V4AB02_9ACTN|nr:class III lanthionine synthetase LanKC [Streptomyces tsukubensis]OON80595.1 serine/threonine protein kinase [Streptomyces tsukubensis]QFR96248.1 lantipeptide synthetase [Streptomyces tsukubensis]
MNPEYAAYCDADRLFYDAPHRAAEADDRSAGVFAATQRPVPHGWERHSRGDWLAYSPIGDRLPAQGWKIHVSATLDNADAVLSRVMEYCVERRIPFKCVPNRRLLLLRNAKYADRAASGKFLTVYPADDDRCRVTAEELDELLGGEPGPYILSDLRWNAGPVHLRYGSFASRFCLDERGELCPAVENPQGRLVPDPRGPVFEIPEWVAPPDFLAPHLRARSQVGLGDVPYTVERALHFSNGGGVYAGRVTATGEKVVLKEGRPYAGLAADGADAVTRLGRERATLERLAGLDCVPRLHGTFVLGDHHFLVEEFVPGTTLNTVFARRFPLAEADVDAGRLTEHVAWAQRMYTLVERAVHAVHARGIAIGDLHLSNVMVSEDESSVVLLDFEAAFPAEEMRRQSVANPAFLAPADRRGTAIDSYALACLRFALFTPLTTLFGIDRRKAAHLAEIIAEVYPVDAAVFDGAVAEVLRGALPATPESGTRDPAAPDPAMPQAAAPVSGTPQAGTRATGPVAARPHGGRPPVAVEDWPRSRDSMVAGILASATPEREDRFFPGDIAQFATPCGGQSFGYGAAGVLYALRVTGAERCQDAEEWLLAKAKEPSSGTPAGFYDGLSGIAWTLHLLGHHAQAGELAHLVTRQPLDGLPAELHGGLAGIGLALDSLAESSDDGTLRAAALRCAELAMDRAGRPGGGSERERTGLLRGGSGLALFLIRMYEKSGDAALLDGAADALRRDLARCVPDERGVLLVREGTRAMPYLGAGSAGIAMVLDDWLAHREDEEFERARAGLLPAARSPFYIQPGLFRGVAGLVLHLGRTTLPSSDGYAADLRRHERLLGWHALSYQGHLAFPGEQLTRLSMDLSTGTAGCLLALGSLRDPRAHLPFLPPHPRRPQSRPPRGVERNTRT